MIIHAISDIHGKTNFDIPKCDILIFGGDICPSWSYPATINQVYAEAKSQHIWLTEKFKSWIDNIDAKYKIGIWGNHDWIGQYSELFSDYGLDILTDQAVTINGINIYGTPWTPYFYNWAFNSPKDNKEAWLLKKWNKEIPKNTDILISHSPPYLIGDNANGDHVGSKALEEIVRNIKPLLTITGHIHSNTGVRKIYINSDYNQDHILVANVAATSIHNNRYLPEHSGISFEIQNHKIENCLLHNTFV